MTLLLQGAGVQAVSAGGGGDPIGDALRAKAAAYYKLDNTLTDSTDNHNDLSYGENPVAYISGKIGAAINVFPPASPFILGNATLDITGHSFAVVGWFMQTVDNPFFNIAMNNGDEEDWVIQYSEEFTPFVNFYMAGSNASYIELHSSFTHLTAGEWYFIACWYNHALHTLNIQIDNGSVDTLDISPVDSRAYNSYFILHRGRIDEVLYIIGEISQEERDYLYNSGSGRALFPAL